MGRDALFFSRRQIAEKLVAVHADGEGYGEAREYQGPAWVVLDGGEGLREVMTVSRGMMSKSTANAGGATRTRRK